MSRRLIHTETRPFSPVVVKVYKSRAWNEYQVEVYLGGTLQPGSTYYTDDRDEAVNSARVMYAATVAAVEAQRHAVTKFIKGKKAA